MNGPVHDGRRQPRPDDRLIIRGPVRSSGHQAWASVGPFATFRTMAHPGERSRMPFRARANLTWRRTPPIPAVPNGVSGADLLDKHPVVDNALTAQIAYEGVYEPPREGLEHLVPSGSASFPFHGRETPLRAQPGQLGLTGADCHDQADGAFRPITEFEYTWFDFDCDYCTGVYDSQTGQGFFLKRWNTESPPPSPTLNIGSTFNFSDNPERTPVLIAAGDNQVTLAWDNLSEVTPDRSAGSSFPLVSNLEAANWQRPIGSSGPTDATGRLLGEPLFDHADSPSRLRQRLVCPLFKCRLSSIL